MTPPADNSKKTKGGVSQQPSIDTANDTGLVTTEQLQQLKSHQDLFRFSFFRLCSVGGKTKSMMTVI